MIKKTTPLSVAYTKTSLKIVENERINEVILTSLHECTLRTEKQSLCKNVTLFSQVYK